jgi:hypothetical protein
MITVVLQYPIIPPRRFKTNDYMPVSNNNNNNKVYFIDVSSITGTVQTYPRRGSILPASLANCRNNRALP